VKRKHTPSLLRRLRGKHPDAMVIPPKKKKRTKKKTERRDEKGGCDLTRDKEI
jgi:hypothetical protein